MSRFFEEVCMLLKFLYLFAIGISGITVGSPSRVTITEKKERCVKGRISTDIEVEVDGEKFNFDPSCRFSFSKSIKTKSGNSCEIKAGMCSSFSPKNLFEVKCKDGSKASIPIRCEQKSRVTDSQDTESTH